MATLNKKLAAIPAAIALLLSSNVFAESFECTVTGINGDPVSGTCEVTRNGGSNGGGTITNFTPHNSNDNSNVVTGGDTRVEIGGHDLRMGDQISSTVISDLFGDISNEAIATGGDSTATGGAGGNGVGTGGNSGGNTFGTSYNSKNRSYSIGSLDRSFNRAMVQCQTAWSVDAGYFFGINKEQYDKECLTHFSEEAQRNRTHQLTMAEFNEYLYQKHAPERTREEFMIHVKDFLIPTDGKDAVNYNSLPPEAQKLYATLMTTTTTLLKYDKEVLAAQNRGKDYTAMKEVRQNRRDLNVRIEQAKIDADKAAFEEAKRRLEISKQYAANTLILGGNEDCAAKVSSKLAAAAGKTDEASAKIRQEAILEAENKCGAEIKKLALVDFGKHCVTNDSYEGFGGDRITFASKCKDVQHGVDEHGNKALFGNISDPDAYPEN